MVRPSILIKTDGMKSEVFVDGKKIEGVIALRFFHDNRENRGTPILQIDLFASNVTLDAEMLPALPEPFNGFYLPISRLVESENIPKKEIIEICRERGICLDIS